MSVCQERSIFARVTAASNTARQPNNRPGPGPNASSGEVELSFETRGEPVQPDKPATVQQAVETFLRDKAGQGLNDGVLKKYQRELARFARFCEVRGRYFLADVILPDLSDFRATWEQEYPSSRTRQKVQERLRGFFRYALNAGFIPRNPAAAFSPIKVDVAPTLPLDAKQYRALLAKVSEFEDPVKAARVRALIRCMRYTGLAIGDAVCLERTKIQHDPKKGITRVVTSRAKTGVDVSVPSPPDVAKELLTVANGNPRYVFRQTGKVNPRAQSRTGTKTYVPCSSRQACRRVTLISYGTLRRLNGSRRVCLSRK